MQRLKHMADKQYLVTSHSGLFVYDQTFDSVILELSGYFYGADQLSDGSIIAAERDSCVAEPNEPTIFWRLVLSYPGHYQYENNTIRNVHQMTRIGSNIYICDTRNDRVAITNKHVYPEIIHSIRFPSEHKDHDTHHINSVSDAGKLGIAIVLHNRGGKDSEVKFFDRKTHEYKGSGKLNLKSVHNLEFVNDVFYCCASSLGQVFSFPESDEPSNAITVGGHPKGMAIDDDTLLVGVSGVASREHRFEIESHVAFIDLKTEKLMDMIYLRNSRGGPIGNINEIRVLHYGN